MTSLAATLALAMSASVGSAQDGGAGAGGGEGAGEGEHTTFDLRGDLSKGDDLDFDRFGAGFDAHGSYDSWDADRDGMLTRDEFNRGMFDTYDIDRSGTLSNEEMVGMQNDRLFSDE